MIDFSKAPEGATHYRDGVSDTILWYKKESSINPDGYKWVWWCSGIRDWSSCGDGAIEATKIPQQLTITCDDERQKMLCEQVIRMCRGEKSERLVGDYWEDAGKEFLSVHEATIYKAKPKKELVVPWEWLPEVIDSITITDCGNVTWGAGYSLMIELDLTDIELPVTVKRPEVMRWNC